MQKKILSLLFISTLIISCANKENSSTENNRVTDTSVAIKNHVHEEEKSIELDNGNQWKVDENMMIYLRAIEKEIQATKGSAKKDFSKLGLSIQKNLDSLTSNCTMSGKAHDELHKWLIPFLDLVSEFNQNNNTFFFNKIDSSMVVFNQFFK